MQQRPPVNRPGQGARPNPAQRPQQRPTGSMPRLRQTAQRPAVQPPAGGGSGDLPKALLIVAGVVVALVATFLLQFKVFPDGRMLTYNETGSDSRTQQSAEISGSSAFQFTEVMSANGSALMDDTGNYPDWVELTNTGSSAMSVEGFVIAQQANATRQFTFPEMTLNPGECVIVFCDNTLASSAGEAFHAPFKLSASGAALMLFNPSGTAVEAINVPAMERNSAYSKDESGAWAVTTAYTPGLANTLENHRTLVDNTATVPSSVVVTEFMASNASFAADEDGEYGDWIEITNNGSEPVNLNGYGLSDSRDKIVKWKFPDVTIAPGAAMIVYCDGKNRTPADGSPLHTNFSLSSERESVLFSNAAGQLITCVDYDILKPDQSMSLQADGTWTTALAPTPGYSNTKESAALIDGQLAAQNTSGVSIGEVKATTGAANDGSASND